MNFIIFQLLASYQSQNYWRVNDWHFHQTSGAVWPPAWPPPWCCWSCPRTNRRPAALRRISGSLQLSQQDIALLQLKLFFHPQHFNNNVRVTFYLPKYVATSSACVGLINMAAQRWSSRKTWCWFFIEFKQKMTINKDRMAPC